MATTRLAIRHTPILPFTSQAVAPVILTARQLLTSHPALADRLRAAGRQLLLVNGWDRLLVGVEKAVVDVVLVDMDAADRSRAGRQHISGHRLVALLARRLAAQTAMRATPGARLAVLTRLDYAEIEDLMRLGVHILARPDHDPDALLRRLCGGQAPAPPTAQTPSVATAPQQTRAKTRVRPPKAAPALAERARLPEPVWRTIAAVIADASPAASGEAHRRRVDDRAVMEGLHLMLLTGGGWAAYPPASGAPSTARRRLQRWRTTGVFTRLAAFALDGDVALQTVLALPWARLGVAGVASDTSSTGNTSDAGARQPAYEVAQQCKQ